MKTAKATKRRPREISGKLIEQVCARVRDNERVRRSLPLGGRIHIDRQLPFLVVYRSGPRPDPGIRELTNSEASHLIAPDVRHLQSSLTALVAEVAKTQMEEFGGFLILELSSRDWDEADPSALPDLSPAFRVVAGRSDDLDPLVEFTSDLLRKVVVQKRSATVEVLRRDRVAPLRLPPVLDKARAAELGCTILGVEVKPVYRQPKGETIYPLVLREMEREVTRVLRQVFFAFAQENTTHRPLHYHGLGRRAVVKAVWEVDRRLAELSNQFDFLLQVTPANTEKAWRQFAKSGHDKKPVFRYRPLPIDPVLLKRQLFQAPLERVEDPAIHRLFREKLIELDRQLSMLADINTDRFLCGSLQLYGRIGNRLRKFAEQVLETIPSRTRDDSRGGALPVAEFVRRAEEELEYYRARHDGMKGTVQLRNDTTGLMVSRGSLLVSREARIPASRAEALLQHEVGTHMVTYYNGRAQPFRQLASGLAGYESLQEGLAVFAEFMVGGLSRPRLRLLAARVVAASRLLDGATFVDTFRELDRTYEFDQRTAFVITTRIYRGGGLTKDAIYLEGLFDLLDYLRKGGDIGPLFLGKMALPHVPIIEELLWRKVLKEPLLRPRFMDSPDVEKRLDYARKARSPLDLVERFCRL